MVATMFVIKEKCQWLLKYLDIFQLSAFFNLTEPDRYKTLLNIITEIQSLVEADVPDQELLQQMWKRSETAITHQNIELGQFEHQGCEKKLKISVLEYVCLQCRSIPERPYQIIPWDVLEIFTCLPSRGLFLFALHLIE